MPPQSRAHTEFCGWLEPYAEKGNNFEQTCGTTTSQLKQCETCGYCRFDPIPTDADLDLHYQTEYPEASAGHYDLEKEYARPDLPGVAAHLIETVRGFGAKAETLETHDYGCAMGNLVHALRQAGVNATGHDVNRDWIERAQKFLGEAISHRPFEETFKHSHRKLHLVTLLHVLEHTPHPLETLLDIRLRLDPYGIVYICVPNGLLLSAEVFGKQVDENFMYPTHLHYFTPQSMRCLLRAAGLRILHLETRAAHFSPSGQASFEAAAAQRGASGPPEETLRNFAVQFRTAELFIMACRDDSPIGGGDPNILAKIALNAPFEQPLWRRIERQVNFFSERGTTYLIADTPIDHIFEWSQILASRRTSGTLKLLDPALIAPAAAPQLMDLLAPAATSLIFVHASGTEAGQQAARPLLDRLLGLGLGHRLIIIPAGKTTKLSAASQAYELILQKAAAGPRRVAAYMLRSEKLRIMAREFGLSRASVNQAARRLGIRRGILPDQ